MSPDPGRLLAERLGVLAPPLGERLFIVHGPGVDDVFIGPDHRARTIEEALWAALRGAGFDRVVYSTLRHPLYFRDARSRDLSRRHPNPPTGQGGSGKARGRRQMRPEFSGPMGRRILTPEAPAAPADATSSPASSVTGSPGDAPARAPALTDQHRVMTLDGYMRQNTTRTAVVLPHAEEWLRYESADRSVANAVAGWVEDAGSDNLCVLVFRQHTLDDVQKYVAARPMVPRLETYLRDQRGRGAGRAAAAIGVPPIAELERLVHTVRLRDGLVIGAWGELPAILRAMAAAGRPARMWRAQLQALARARRPLDLAELRARRLVDGHSTGTVSAAERLDRLIGLAPVKRRIGDLRQRMETDAALRATGRGGNAEPPSRHLVFTGNPGTGKTTVARLVGEIYRDLGVLSRGHLVTAEVRDLVAGVMGQTAIRTNDMVDRALDGVLFIDEAYRLSDQGDGRGFGQEAIDALLSRMEDDRDRLVVIAAGYPRKMTEFLDSNPGLRSRVPEANVIPFPDFTGDELHAVLLSQLRHADLTWTPELEALLREITAGMDAARDGGFGNARAMRDLADDLTTQWSLRVRTDVAEPLDTADVPEQYLVNTRQAVPDVHELLASLDEFVGMDQVAKVVRSLVTRLRLRMRRGTGDIAAPHMLFVGPPGTGKTTIALRMGELLRAMGLLRRGHTVEVTRAELVGEHLGETAPKTQAAIQSAVDGVLFIDEAYSLSEQGERDMYGAEAIVTLTREMQSLSGRLVVIAAGYPDAMDDFLARNAGLRSRFGERVEFPHYDSAALVEILRRQAAPFGYAVPDPTAARVSRYLDRQRVAQGREFGNARTVGVLLEAMEARMGDRLGVHATDDGDEPLVFLPEDVPDDHQ